MRAEDFLKEKQSAEEFLSASKPRPGEIDTRTSKPVPPAFEEESILKPIGEDIQENWTRYAGATVGSVAGVPGGPAGMILGATLGGAAGESYKQLGQHLGEPEAAPKTSLEAAKKIGMAGTKSAAEEVVGIAGGKVIGKVLAPFSKTITDDARIAYDVLDKYMPKATGLKPVSRSLGKKVPAILPAEMTEHRGLDILHNIAEKSIIGGRSIADYKNIVRRGAVEDMVDDLADSFGKQVDADVLGETITDLISTKFKAFKDSVTTPLYNRVAELTTPKIVGKIESGGVLTDIRPLKKFMASKRRLIKDVGSIESSNAGDDVVGAISDLPDMVQFDVANELRKRLISKSEGLSLTNKNAPAVGLSKRATSMLDTQISSSLKKGNPEAHELWRQANSLYKTGSEKFNNRFLRRLVKKAEDEPERVLNMVFKNGGIKGLKRTRVAVGEDGWSQLKNWYVRDVLNKATMKDGSIDGSGLLQRIYSKKGGMGEDALKHIFDKNELSQIRGVATALKVSQGRQAEGAGGMLIQLTQAGAVAGLAYGQFPKAAGVLLIGPKALSSIMLNPIASKWLSTGLKAPKITPNVLAAMTRLTSLSERIEKTASNQNDQFETQ